MEIWFLWIFEKYFVFFILSFKRQRLWYWISVKPKKILEFREHLRLEAHKTNFKFVCEFIWNWCWYITYAARAMCDANLFNFEHRRTKWQSEMFYLFWCCVIGYWKRATIDRAKHMCFVLIYSFSNWCVVIVSMPSNFTHNKTLICFDYFKLNKNRQF